MLADAQAAAAKQRSDQDAQWAGHSLIVMNNPFTACDGVYLHAGVVNGAPYGRNVNSGLLLFFVPSDCAWRIASLLEHASADICVSSVSCIDAQMCVPLGKREWRCWNGERFETALVRVARMPEAGAESQRQILGGKSDEPGASAVQVAAASVAAPKPEARDPVQDLSEEQIEEFKEVRAHLSPPACDPSPRLEAISFFSVSQVCHERSHFFVYFCE